MAESQSTTNHRPPRRSRSESRGESLPCWIGPSMTPSYPPRFAELFDGGTNPGIASAAADIARHGCVDLGITRPRGVREQRRGGHDLAALAIAALRHVQGQPFLLNPLSDFGPANSLDGGNGQVAHGVQPHLAGSRRRAIRMHGASSALADAAA